ncbi:MAG: hypothetical protein MI742_18105 [Desulfobacterales bacterium]|nr:hypothetical protein [Desulfobacterales bacterium]
MSHHHDHHHHDHETQPLTLKEQLEKLIPHWIDHNDAHKGTYLKWAEKARGEGFAETADLIEEIATVTQTVTDKLKQALTSLPE